MNTLRAVSAPAPSPAALGSAVAPARLVAPATLATDAPPPLDSHEFCSLVVRREARNFAYAFSLLPEDRRRGMNAIYAFFRQTDDLVDQNGPVELRRDALNAWRGQLNHALSSETTTTSSEWPGMAALVETVRRHAIPPRHLHEVIDGVEMDLEHQGFEDFDALRNYCYHVASAVGLTCLHLWGFDNRDGRAVRLAEHCGIALQLTNILRDVQEDAREGRIYLPRAELARFGVDPASLAEMAHPAPGELRALLEFQAQRAETFYREAAPLAGLVDPVGRPVLGAIVGIYHALLHEIVRRDYNVWGGRVRVARWRKLIIAGRAWWTGRRRPLFF